MLLAFFILMGVTYEAYGIYDEYSAKKEVEGAVSSISNQIAFVINTAPEYSVERRVDLIDTIHGEPYVFVVDKERYNVRIRLMGRFSNENITDFAMLPPSAIRTEGFNSNGEVSVGTSLSGMNMSRAVTVSRDGDYIVISAGV